MKFRQQFMGESRQLTPANGVAYTFNSNSRSYAFLGLMPSTYADWLVTIAGRICPNGEEILSRSWPILAIG